MGVSNGRKIAYNRLSGLVALIGSMALSHPTYGEPALYDLIANRDGLVGEVSMTYADGVLAVSIDTSSSGWLLGRVRLHAGTDFSEFPLRKSGEPDVPKYEHQVKRDFDATPVTIMVNLGESVPEGGSLLVSVVADVLSPNGKKGKKDEAWAAGLSFRQGKPAQYVIWLRPIEPLAYAANDDNYLWVDVITNSALFWLTDATYQPAFMSTAAHGVLSNDTGSGLAVALVSNPNLEFHNDNGTPTGITLSLVNMHFWLNADGSFVLTHDLDLLTNQGILNFAEGYLKFQYKLTDQVGQVLLDDEDNPFTAWATIHVVPDTSHVSTTGYEPGMESFLQASTVQGGNLVTPQFSIPLATEMPVVNVAIAPHLVTFTVQPPVVNTTLTLTTSLSMVTGGSACPQANLHVEGGTEVLCCSVPVVAGVCSGVSSALSSPESLRITGCTGEFTSEVHFFCGGNTKPTTLQVVTTEPPLTSIPVVGMAVAYSLCSSNSPGSCWP